MEILKHECGVAMIRLLKPLDYYEQKYGTWMYGLNKLYLLMEKQHNRGQEGAGLAAVKLQVEPGAEYMFRERAEGSGAISEIFQHVQQHFRGYTAEQLHDASFAESHIPFAGEAYMGHLRYSTTGKSGLSYVHPFLRRNNWRAKNLALCGNFNLTNVDEVFDHITSLGQHPRAYADTFIMLEQVGHRLDREAERCYVEARDLGLEGMDITHYIDQHIDLARVLRSASPLWDGGYVICGLTGSGESFALRDPWGIRPAFWYQDDEVCVLASERPVIQTAFNVASDRIRELEPGEALLISQAGQVRTEQVNAPRERSACSFERIYFSRGSDADIYQERKMLGRELVPQVLKAIDEDVDHTVFSFIPNTAESAFFGMAQGLDEWLNEQKAQAIAALGPTASPEELSAILSRRIRREKVAVKDIKLRTFITESNSRDDLAAHVYDITYGTVRPEVDNLVVIDDSIVRGTTLRQSIIGILARLRPKKIVIVSSSPQVRYPDYYGIDMPRLEEFCVFRATVALLKERGMEDVLEKVYNECLAELAKPHEEMQNAVRDIYAPFTVDEINHKIVEMLRPEGMTTPIDIVYQSLDGLHQAIPNHPGDWYFSGHYPTPGGTRLCNQAYVNYYEKVYKPSASQSIDHNNAK